MEVLLGGAITLVVASVFFFLTTRDLMAKLRPFARAAELLLPRLHPAIDQVNLDVAEGELTPEWSVMALAINFVDGSQEIYSGPHTAEVEGEVVKVLSYEQNAVVGEHRMKKVRGISQVKSVQHP